ncbi:alpha/beta hydrolase [Lactobacillus xylocopicola]|uniref:Alpha/beta hydrolase n=1 Tax=Lactobacillus xylocopicola TaxID=2976676 RepID=A0ABN6SJM1_9LACO|nr:alpha/beta hydrolase [Lactobacillus xylocopicola]BDR59868.1 alpha/beta hydrolase [Lactobacillus xylocopicola]
MFFNTKKYKEEAEKNRKHNLSKEPSQFNMLFLAALATFVPLRAFLRFHPKKTVTDQATIEDKHGDFAQVPIIYFHGFRGGDYTTNAMVKQALKDKGSTQFLKVTADLLGNFKLEGTWTGDPNPIVQVIFRQRLVNVYTIDYYLSFVLPFLANRYHFKNYAAVAHSLACPCIVRTEMRTARKANFPRLTKCAFVAGPFNGTTYMGDIPNVNGFNQNGRPTVVYPHYFYLLLYRKRFNPNIAILNIYGNVLDNTNSDKFISVTSAKSIRYILAPNANSYHEVEIRGQKYAEHSWMHDNPFVINIIDEFIGLSK